MARSKDPALEKARREAITDAAIGLLEESSWRSMTLSQVAKKAGVSKGVVTYWYTNKDALLLEAVQRFHGRYEERLLHLAEGEGSVRSRLEALLEALLPGQEELARELHFHVEILSYAKEHETVRASIKDAYEQFQRVCEALLAVGVEEGYVTTPDVEHLAFFVHALIDGLSMRMAYASELDIVALRARLLGLLERWLQAPPKEVQTLDAT